MPQTAFVSTETLILPQLTLAAGEVFV
jgi:hypothetical protein